MGGTPGTAVLLKPGEVVKNSCQRQGLVSLQRSKQRESPIELQLGSIEITYITQKITKIIMADSHLYMAIPIKRSFDRQSLLQVLTGLGKALQVGFQISQVVQ